MCITSLKETNVDPCMNFINKPTGKGQMDSSVINEDSSWLIWPSTTDALIMFAVKEQIDNIFEVVWIANNILNQNVMQGAEMINLIHCAIFDEYLCAIKNSFGVFAKIHLSSVAILM
jgi:hypothetical protein